MDFSKDDHNSLFNGNSESMLEDSGHSICENIFLDQNNTPAAQVPFISTAIETDKRPFSLISTKNTSSALINGKNESKIAGYCLEEPLINSFDHNWMMNFETPEKQGISYFCNQLFVSQASLFVLSFSC